MTVFPCSVTVVMAADKVEVKIWTVVDAGSVMVFIGCVTTCTLVSPGSVIVFAGSVAVVVRHNVSEETTV